MNDGENMAEDEEMFDAESVDGMTEEELEGEGEADDEGYEGEEEADFGEYQGMETGMGSQSTVVNVMAQPLKTIVSSNLVVGADGKIRPECRISIERNLPGDTDLFAVITEDAAQAVLMAKEMLNSMKK